MKISVTIGNKATIPTGNPYENISPLYSLTWEHEVGAINDSQAAEKASKALLEQMRGIINSQILADMNVFKDCRKNCTCHPIWHFEKQRLQHDMTCPSCHAEDK